MLRCRAVLPAVAAAVASSSWRDGGAAAATAPGVSLLAAVSRRHIFQRPACDASSHERPPADAAAEDATAAAARRAVLQSVLEAAGMGFPALMSVLKADTKARVPPGAAAHTFARMAEHFGSDAANAMVQSTPDLLRRGNPGRLAANFAALVGVLGGGEKYALRVVRAAPELLTHSPDSVATRLQLMCRLLQVDQPTLRKLLVKAPITLKRSPERMAELVAWLQAAGGLTPQQVFKVFLGWPVLATSTRELLQARHGQLQQLFGLPPERMQALVATYPALLGRVPEQLVANIDSLAQHLQLPQEQVVAIAAKNPGLLSWNVSSLLSRMTLVCQVLRLPPELRVTLLSTNKPLLTHHAAIAERIAFLKQALQIEESELLPLLHQRLTIMRLPVQLMHQKWDTVDSLALLHPPWAEAHARATPAAKLRLLQAGPACFWRLVYLVQTGQQHVVALQHAATLSHVAFNARFPAFRPWLDRYNALVSAADIPVVPSAPQQQQQRRTTAGERGRSVWHYPPIVPDVMMGRRLHGGSLFLKKHRLAAQELSSSSGSSSSGAAGLQQQRGGDQPALPAGPAGMLAAWLGVDCAAAEGLLLLSPKSCAVPMAWHEWQQQLAPLEALLRVLGHLEQQRQPHAAQQGSSAGKSSASGACAPTPAPAASSPLLLDAAAACTVAASDADAAPVASLAGGGDDEQQHAAPQQHQLQLQSASGFKLLRTAPAAVQHALRTGCPQALAAVSLAAHLAPFTRALLVPELPPRPPTLVVQLLLAHPAIVARKKAFRGNAAALANLAAASPHLRQQLAAQSLEQLVRCCGAPAPRLLFLQFLVTTQPPGVPWTFSLHQLLVQGSWSVAGRSKVAPRAAFTAAYPGYQAWEDSMQRV